MRRRVNLRALITFLAGLICCTILRGQGPFGLQSVSGAPFSGELVSERTTISATGEERKQPPEVERLYRDSAGRTRLEILASDPAGAKREPTLITISDPLAGYNYRLEAGSHVVTRMYVGIHPLPPSSADSPVFLPAPPGGHVPNTTDCVQSTTELLGSKYIDGVLVDGQRTTGVFPAGCQGSAHELTVVSEMWVARVLRVLMLLESTDPRIGETTIRLQGLNQTDPDPHLFQPPEGYIVLEQSPPAKK
jgi:hypothetical protein